MLDTIKKCLIDNEMETAWILLYLQDEIVLGRYKNSELIFPAKEINWNKCFEIHLFNEDKELRSGKNFVFKELLDPKSSDGIDYFIDEFMFMIGTEERTNLENGMSILQQNGRELKVTFQSANKLRLHVRHLFDPETGFMNGYRLVDVLGGD